MLLLAQAETETMSPMPLTPEDVRCALWLSAGSLVFDPGAHRYTMARRPVPSVTTIADAFAKGDGLIQWACNTVGKSARARLAAGAGLHGIEHTWRFVRDEAGEHGTEVHALIEAHLRRLMGESAGQPEGEPSQAALDGYHRWCDWLTTVDLVPLAVEGRIYSAAHSYAGTFDLLAYLNGVLTLLDWKTSADCWPGHKLQSYAYRGALVEAGLPLPDGCVVCIPKDGSRVKATPIPWSEAGWRAFVGIRQALAWHEGEAA